MAAITINGTFRTHEITKIPGFVYAYPMSDFYIGAVAITAASPEVGDNPYKTAAVTAVAGAGDNVGTTVYTFSMILPSTVDADVNPVGARWGLYVFDNEDVPRLMHEISDLESFFLLATPTTVSLLDVRVQQGTSTPWPPSGGDQTVTGVLTVTGNLIVGGNVNGRDPDNFIDGFGTSNAYAIYTDSNTIQNGYLKQESLAVTMDGAGTAPEIRMMTNGLAGETNRTLGVLYADPNVIELTARRNGTFSAQVTAIRLNALGTTGEIQFSRDGTALWKMVGTSLIPGATLTGVIGSVSVPLGFLRMAGDGGVLFYDGSSVVRAGFSSTASAMITIGGVAADGAGLQFPPKTATPANPSSSSEVNVYVKGGKIIFQYNDAGTTRWKSLDLTGTGVTWVAATSAP